MATLARLLPGRKRTLARRSLRVNVVGTVLLVLLLFLTVYPLFMLLYGSVRSAAPGMPGVFTLNGYVDAYSDPATYQTWANSVILATTVTLLSTAIAVFFAFVVARTDVPLRGWV